MTFQEEGTDAIHYQHLKVSGVKGEITFTADHAVELSGDVSQVVIDYYDEEYNHFVVRGGGKDRITVSPEETGLVIKRLQGEYTVERLDKTWSIQSSEVFSADTAETHVQW